MKNELLETIASMIKDGSTSGDYPNWTINIDNENNQEVLNHIANLVKQGITSENDPKWKLRIFED